MFVIIDKFKKNLFLLLYPLRDTILKSKLKLLSNFFTEHILYDKYKSEILKGRFSRANIVREQLNSTIRKTVFERVRANFNDLDNINVFSRQYFAHHLLDRCNPVNKRYYGKKIAILGPSLKNLDDKIYNEINGYDFVFIPNYNSKSSHYGRISRNIVSLYRIKDIDDNKQFKIDVLSDLYEIILTNYDFRKILKPKLDLYNYRYTLPYRDVFYF
jgi:hypothetical protein